MDAQANAVITYNVLYVLDCSSRSAKLVVTVRYRLYFINIMHIIKLLIVTIDDTFIMRSITSAPIGYYILKYWLIVATSQTYLC